MHIAVVGPTHPYKGGVAAHTTELAHHLADAGHRVELVSWSRLYPHLLYPGEQAVPDGDPDVPPYEPTTRSLRWDRPGSWWRVGRSLQGHDVVVVVAVVPAQVPALLTLIRAARRGPGVSKPRVVVLAHNVVPHETHIGGGWLMSRLLHAADTVLVHSPAMAEQAREHGARHVLQADLPPHLPGGTPHFAPRAGRRGDRLSLLSLGMVRDYKGVDLLLRAAALVPDVSVQVAGEQWGRAGERVRALAGDPALAGRVGMQAGYVPGHAIAGLLDGSDVLALPYRDATASQNVLLAHAYGLPVLASAVGTFPDQVRDGVDGLLVPPGDDAAMVAGLAAALRRLAAPGELERLQAGVPAVDLVGPWASYVQQLVAGTRV